MKPGDLWLSQAARDGECASKILELASCGGTYGSFRQVYGGSKKNGPDAPWNIKKPR